MIDVSFVIITWNSGIYIQPCLDSLTYVCREEDIAFEVIIVDNGSHDGTAEIVKRYQIDRPNVYYFIKLDTNMGTTYSRNIGLRMAKGRIICILDSDTEFSTGALADTITCLERDDSIGIVAPKLLFPDGTVQKSVKRFPAFWHKLLKIPKIIFGIKYADADYYKDFPFHDTTSVDTAISACWFFRKTLLDTVGFLDEKIFYSPEDIDYCRRLKNFGKIIVYYPYLTIIHHTQQITHKNPFSKISWSHFLGLIYYYRKHGGWFY